MDPAAFDVQPRCSRERRERRAYQTTSGRRTVARCGHGTTAGAPRRARTRRGADRCVARLRADHARAVARPRRRASVLQVWAFDSVSPGRCARVSRQGQRWLGRPCSKSRLCTMARSTQPVPCPADTLGMFQLESLAQHAIRRGPRLGLLHGIEALARPRGVAALRQLDVAPVHAFFHPAALRLFARSRLYTRCGSPSLGQP